MPFNKLSCQFTETKTDFTVTLKKTIGISKHGISHKNSPGKGDFSFYMHDDQRIVTIGKEEALWFSFEGNQHTVAVKVLMGGINAITGEKEIGAARTVLKNNDQEEFGQNYMIVPGQHLLYGFKKRNAIFGRFIPASVGKASREEKSEQTQLNKIQIIVIPLKKEILEQQAEAERQRLDELAEIARLQNQFNKTIFERFGYYAEDLVDASGNYDEDYGEYPGRPFIRRSLTLKSKKELAKMGFGPTDMVAQNITPSYLKAYEFDVAQAQYIELSLIDAKQWSKLTKLPEPPREPTVKEFTGSLWFDSASGQPTADIEAETRLRALDGQDKLAAAAAFSQETSENVVPGGLKTKEFRSAKPGFFTRLLHCCPCSPPHEDAEDEVLDFLVTQPRRTSLLGSFGSE